MSLQQEIKNATLPGIRDDLIAVAHKLAHPMAAILAMVPGESLAERARAIGVSRQTMYAWAQERFRPDKELAQKIAGLTGIPAEHIGDYREGKRDGNGGAGEPAGAEAPRLEQAGKGLSRRAERKGAERRGVVAQQGKRRHDRTARVRNPRRPRGGKSD